MRRTLGGVVVCWAALMMVAGVSTASAASPRIIGGTETTIQQVPWQVIVYSNSAPRTISCGGSILDATHVLTAAHCVHSRENNPSSVLRPADSFTVSAGSTHFTAFDPTQQNVLVSAVSADSRYNGADFDAAVLTLATPLVFDGVNVRPITLGTTTPADGAPLTVSGWGITGEGQPPSETLMITTVNVVNFASCNSAYMGDFTAASVICAIAPGHDACEGDSGGPLVDASGFLVGIVSSGNTTCNGDVSAPGVYTNTTDCRVKTYIQTAISGTGPGSCSPPALSGTPSYDQTLTCTNGTWTGTPAFTYDFVDQASGTVLQTGASTTYALSAGNAGQTIYCRVTATDPTGSRVVQSNSIGPIAGPPPPPPPPAADKTAPSAKITDAACTRTQCIFHVTVTDASPSSGIASVAVTRRTTTKKSCVVKGRHTTCSHTTYKTLSATRLADGRYKVTASNLPYGTHRFSARATDKAGNAQYHAATATRTTHAPHH